MAANLGDLITTTARKFSEEIEDNLSADIPLLARLIQRGNLTKYSGGRTIDEAVLYGTNNSVAWFDGYETFTPPTTDQEVVDAAEFSLKQQGGFIAVSGREEKMNSGEARRYPFVETRFKQLKAVLKNTFATSLFSDGTGSASKEITGLQAMVPDNPATGTYGGINRATNSFWRSKISAAAATSASNIQARMNAMYLQIKRNDDKPDLWVGGDNMFTYYWTSLQAIQQVGNAKKADAGYLELEYLGSQVVHDPNCATTRLYALNTDNMFLRVWDEKLYEKGDMRQISNADYKVWPMFFFGNLTTNRCAAHGLIISS